MKIITHETDKSKWKWYNHLHLNALMYKYARLATRYPYRCLSFIVTLCIAMSAITIGGRFMVIDNVGDGLWDVRGHRETLRGYGLSEAMTELSDSTSPLPRSLKNDVSTTFFIYSSKDGSSLLTAESLDTIRRVENIILQHPLYPEYCQLRYLAGDTNSTTCVVPNTILAHVYEPDAVNGGYSDTLLNNQTLDQILTTLPTVASSFFFMKGYEAADGVGGSSRLRSSIAMGEPLVGISNKKVGNEIYKRILKSCESQLVNLLGMKGTLIRTPYMDTKHRQLNGVSIGWFSGDFYTIEFGRAPNLDFTWVVLSLICVYAYMYYHIRSVPVLILSLVMNVLCFPVAHFIFRLICQVDLFMILHLLLMFLLLGISADNTFVFADAFAQSAAIPGTASELERRVSYTAQRSANALLVTSGTTCASFFVIAITPIPPIGAFGIYAGWLIFVLYVLTITILPPVFAIWSKHFEGLPCCPLFRNRTRMHAMREEIQCRRDALSHPRAPSSLASTTITTPPKDCDSPDLKRTSDSDAALKSSSGLIALEEEEAMDVQEDKLRSVERFFHDYVNNFVYRFRYVIVVVFCGIFIVGAIFTAKLAPPEKADVWFPKQHFLQKASDDLFRESAWDVVATDRFANVYYLFGVEGNTRGTKRWQVDRGHIIWDPAFDPTTPAAQSFLVNLCANLKTKPNGLVKDTVTCWTDGFATYLTTRYPSDTTKRLGSLSSTDFMANFVDWRRTDSNAKSIYFDQLGAFANATAPSGYTIKYLAFKIETTLEVPNAVEKVLKAVNAWDAYVSQMQALAPPEIRTAYVTDDNAWVFSATQIKLVESAREELGVIFPIAFAVINLSIGNLWVSIPTLGAVAGIVVTTMGIGVHLIMGWPLGTAESIVIVILVGYAMDYVLYISKAYAESPASLPRKLRTREALTHLGVSVLAGTISNILASVWLWGTVFEFFKKFAFLIVFATPVAFLWSCIFLPAVFHICGPEGESGEWSAWIRNVRLWLGNMKEGRKWSARSAVANSDNAGDARKEVQVTEVSVYHK